MIKIQLYGVVQLSASREIIYTLLGYNAKILIKVFIRYTLYTSTPVTLLLCFYLFYFFNIRTKLYKIQSFRICVQVQIFTIALIVLLLQQFSIAQIFVQLVQSWRKMKIERYTNILFILKTLNLLIYYFNNKIAYHIDNSLIYIKKYKTSI